MYLQHLTGLGINLAENGKESFFGISTDAANEPYNHGAVYLENNEALVYWLDNRFGESKIYGSKITSSFDGTGDIFSEDVNGQLLTSLPLAQETPKAILADNKIFLSFQVEESPNQNLYFQLLNMDLSQNGNATALSDPATSKQGFDMVYGEDGYIYYAYSEDYDIAVNKISSSGDVQWSVTAVVNSADDIINSIYPYPGSGCVIIYESQSFEEGSHIYALAVDGNGQAISGWPVSISNLSGDQYYDGSVLTENGIFISFRDNSSGNYDIYGQYVVFNGNLIFGVSGQDIASGSFNQQSSSVAYNQNLDEVFVCYETEGGSETDLNCKEIDLSEQDVGETIIISSHDDNQNNPFVYWSGHSFMIAWEDNRNNSESNPGGDIYFQEYKNGEFSFAFGGYNIASFTQKQERPIITKYSDTANLYAIIWEDYRSTGKEFCANLYGQSYTSESCSNIGDCNGDGTWNVLDIVSLANCVLAQNCPTTSSCACAGDLNEDGVYNVLDIVTLANCVLAQNCGGGRVDDATESSLIMKDNMVSIEADGFIGGVQMTLTHGDDFSIEMTDRALLAEYITTGNETRLLVITPETDELFSFSGDFEIAEIIVANSQYEISVDLPLAVSFSLSGAYPNPFNPTTTMELFMPAAGDMKVEVYNLLGQSVATLASGYREKGTYDLTWDAADISSGMYFIKAQADGFTAIQKLMLIK